MPERKELVALAAEWGELTVVDDLGSGLILREPLPGLEDEPRVADAVADGAHIICFSGDKLLGGPQCGLLIGDAARIAAVRRHPLYRAFRCDKVTLAALEATLRVYRDGDPLRDVPTLRALAAPPDWLERRAGELAGKIGHGAAVVPSDSFAGSGANPARPLPSFAVALLGGEAVAARLRAPGVEPAVFARIEKDRVLLDLRTLELEDLDEVARVVSARL
jgi:L-seryl-tRNA(Ser) seleniumtransferase